MKPQDQVIEQWMTQVSQDGGIARYDDLHLDAIDGRWKNREFWTEGSRLAFQSGIDVRDKLKLPFTLGLGMSLRPDSEIASSILLAELILLTDWSPPSLYLFYQGQEPGSDGLKASIDAGHIEADGVALDFTPTDVPAAKSAVFLFFKLRESEEYVKSAFILG